MSQVPEHAFETTHGTVVKLVGGFLLGLSLGCIYFGDQFSLSSSNAIVIIRFVIVTSFPGWRSYLKVGLSRSPSFPLKAAAIRIFYNFF
jgi:hypothetical protein